MNCRQSSIDVLNLSARSTHGLQRAGINTIEQMLKLSEEDLYEIPMLGKKSVEEILAAQTNLMYIDEYLGNFEENHKHSGQTPNKNYETSNLSEQEILEYLDRNHVKTSVLSLLPARTYNYLLLAGYTELSQIIFMSDAELQEIPHIDSTSAAEIRKICNRYLRDYQDSILEEQNRNRSVQKKVDNLFKEPNNRETIFKYVKENDVFISDLGLSIRAVNALKHTAIADSYRLMRGDCCFLDRFLNNAIKQPYFSDMDISYKTPSEQIQWVKQCCSKPHIIYSPYLTDRQRMQSGMYLLFPNEIKAINNVPLHFRTSIKELPKDDDMIETIITIPKEKKKQILDELDMLGINKRTLFSDSIDMVNEEIQQRYQERKHY